jgi:glycosyl transferase family 25
MSLTCKDSIKCLDNISNAFYINLEHRTDRKEHVEKELASIGIKASRFNAIKMANGAIGCSMSHLKILEDAKKNGLDHLLIVEDDITFLNSELFVSQINRFFELHGNNWDVILFAGNNMPPYEVVDDSCVQVSRCQTTTGYLVNGHYISALASNVKMGLTNLLNKPDEKPKYAIDKFWFVLQSASKWFLITPLTVVQREDYSDIEQKVTNYQSLMQDLDKAALFKAINEMRQNEMRQNEMRQNEMRQNEMRQNEMRQKGLIKK